MSKILGFFCGAAFFFLSVSAASADFASPSKNISNSALGSLCPKIAGTDGSPNLFLIWMEETDATLQRLCFAKSGNLGITWTAPLDLTSTGQVRAYGNTDDAENSYSICVEEPLIHVVYNWRADDTDDWEIFYRRSLDGGWTWEAPRQITDNASSSINPDVAARGSFVHVTYQDNWPGTYAIMYKRLASYGDGAIDQVRRLTFSATAALHPRIAVSSSGLTVSIVYEGPYNNVLNIFYKHISDSGAGGYDTRQLTFGATENAAPDIATSGGADLQYVYIVYTALWPGNLDVMYKRLNNFGAAGFTTYTARLTYSTTDSYAPAVEFDTESHNVHIAYADAWTGNPEVMYRKLSDFGGAGFAGQRVSWSAAFSSYPSLASNGLWASIAWMDYAPGNFEIYFKYGY